MLGNINVFSIPQACTTDSACLTAQASSTASGFTGTGTRTTLRGSAFTGLLSRIAKFIGSIFRVLNINRHTLAQKISIHSMGITPDSVLLTDPNIINAAIN